LLTIVFVAGWVARREWPAAERGAVVGFLFGLIISAVVIRKVPLETQLVVIGAVLGIGTDFISTLKEPGGPKTAVGSVSKLIVSTARSIRGAAKTSGFDEPDHQVVTSGLWTFIGTILFTLIFGNLF
jgi:hypothetical protein